MLSILPFDRASSSQRETERPFKSYPRVPVSLPTSSFYSPFATHPSFGVGSYFPSSAGFPSSSSLSHSHHSAKSSSTDFHHPHHHSHHHPSSSSSSSPGSTTPGTMDLRPPSHHLEAMPNLMDISQSTPGGPPHPGAMGQLRSHMEMMHPSPPIKQEQANCSLASVSNSLPQMSMYQPLMSQSHGMGAPQQSSLSQSQLSHHHSQGPSSQQTQQSGQQQQPDPTSCVRAPSSPVDTSNNSNSGAQSNNHDHNGDGGFRMPPKKRPLAVPDNQKDNGYWEKRKKNNDSAKRSRDARRMKEEQIAMRVVYLEQENLQLRTEVSLLKSEIEKLRCMLYNS